MRILIVVLIFSLNLSCSKKESAEQHDRQLMTGYQLIDDNRSTEAIEHFSSLLEKNPENPDYIRGLGSAYAARAGFKVANLIGPIKELKGIDSVKESYESQMNAWAEENPKILPLKSFILAELEIIAMVKKFALIPTFTAQETDDLKMAVSTYLSLPDPTQGDYLYIAVLEALTMKSEILESVLFINCNQYAIAVQDRFFKIASRFSLILHHMELGQPSRKENFIKQQENISASLNKLSTLTSDSLLALSVINATHADPTLRLFPQKLECN